MQEPAEPYVIDFETRSRADLKAEGADRYAKDESTGVWCLAYAPVSKAREPAIWHPGLEPPANLVGAVRAGGSIIAYNAPFEYLIWNYVLRRDDDRWPELHEHQLDDTMARALAMGLPADLFRCAKVLGVPIEKDADGHRLMLQLARPRKKTDDWWDDEAKIFTLYEYCRQDVRVEAEVHKRLPPLTKRERAVYSMDFRINRRGVKVDLPTVRRAKQAVSDLSDAATAELQSITCNEVTGVNQVAKLKDWALGRGVKMASLRKGEVAEMIRRTEDAKVKRALEIRQEAGLNSVKKFKAMEASACPDGRARGLYQYHGAAVTGRWGGRRIQPQNLLRPAFDQEVIDEIICHLYEDFGADWIDFLFGSGIHAIASCCRAMLTCEDGNTLLAADFSNIEGRVIAWLAGEESKVEAFRAFDRGEGHDLYKIAYGKSFGIDPAQVSKDQRLIGKVQELALGFGGGLGAFASMARNYGLTIGPKGDLTEDQVEEIKRGWRDAHPMIVKFWRRLEMAAMSAIRAPGQIYPAGPYIRYRYLKIGGVPYLLYKLPSGRTLAYPHARIDRETGQVMYFGEDAYTGQLAWIKLWGGHLSENVTQAVARDVLVDAMFRVERHGYEIVMHTHDEIVVEAPPDADLGDLETLMAVPPAWCEDLPIAVEGWRSARYRK